MTTDVAKETWDALGYEIEATGYRLWVRTDDHHRKSKGGIWLSPKYQGFHGTMPHMVTMYATVLAAGPLGVAAEFKPGDRVMFKRLHMGMWDKLGGSDPMAAIGECVVGFIDANEVLGFAEEGVAA